MELQNRLVRLSAGSDWISQFLAVFGLALIIIGHDKWSCLALISSGLSPTVVLFGTATAVMVLAAQCPMLTLTGFNWTVKDLARQNHALNAVYLMKIGLSILRHTTTYASR